MEDAIEDAKWRAGLRYDEAAWTVAHLMAASGNYGKQPPKVTDLLGRQPFDLDPRVVPEPMDEEAQEKAERTAAFLEEHNARMSGEDR